MLILFSTVLIIYLYQLLTQYQIHTTIKDQKLIVRKKINDTVKYILQTWIIYFPRVIPYHIVNDYIAVKLDGGIRGVKTELRQKVLLHVSFSELHIDKL